MDIIMCKGGECPFRAMCYRFTSTPKKHNQSYFTEPPYKIIDGKPECEMFWGEASQQLMEQLNSIVNGTNKDR